MLCGCTKGAHGVSCSTCQVPLESYKRHCTNRKPCFSNTYLPIRIKQICAFSPLIFFFYFSGFIVFDSVSRGGLLSSGGSVVRVVGDRSQFCFTALGRQSGSITLNMVLSAETPLTVGGPAAHQLWTEAEACCCSPACT